MILLSFLAIIAVILTRLLSSASQATGELVCGNSSLMSDGFIKSPNYPSAYPANTYCAWNITADPGMAVKLAFLDFNLSNAMDSINIYSYNQNGTRINAVTLTGNSTPSFYEYGGSQTTILFISGAAAGGAGFFIHFTSICEWTLQGEGLLTMPAPPLTFPSSKVFVCLWTLTAAPGKVLTVAWLNSSATDNAGDLITIVNGTDGAVQNYLGRGIPYYVLQGQNVSLDSTAIISITKPSSGNFSSYSFVFYSSEKPKRTSSAAQYMCGEPLYGQGDIISPGFTQGFYPNNANCTWTLTAFPGDFLRLQLYYTDLEAGFDILNIYNGTSISTQNKLFAYSNTFIERTANLDLAFIIDLQNHVYLTLGNSATVTFSSDAFGQRSGFSIKFTSVHAEGAREGSGNLTIPSSLNERTETWTLSHSPNLSLALGCISNQSYLQITISDESGFSANELYLVCLESGNPSLMIPYLSSYFTLSITNNEASSGSILLFDSVAPPSRNTSAPVYECGSPLYGGGHLSAPSDYSNGFKFYVANALCTWTLTALPNAYVKLEFAQFSLDNGFDTLKVYNSSVVNEENLVAWYTGYFQTESLPTLLLGSTATVVFASDGFGQGQGFQITFFSAYDEAVKDNGVRTSLNYPNVYPSLTFNTWILSPPPGYTTILKFIDVRLRNSDVLSIYKGLTTSPDNRLIAYAIICPYCKIYPRDMEISGDVTITLRAYGNDNVETGFGFYVRFNSDINHPSNSSVAPSVTSCNGSGFYWCNESLSCVYAPAPRCNAIQNCYPYGEDELDCDHASTRSRQTLDRSTSFPSSGRHLVARSSILLAASWLQVAAFYVRLFIN